MSDKRLYVVSSSADKGQKLVRASSQAEVRRHLTRLFTIELATPQQVAELYEAGVRAETAENGE